MILALHRHYSVLSLCLPTHSLFAFSTFLGRDFPDDPISVQTAANGGPVKLTIRM
jgi:hypothetical protein